MGELPDVELSDDEPAGPPGLLGDPEGPTGLAGKDPDGLSIFVGPIGSGELEVPEGVDGFDGGVGEYVFDGDAIVADGAVGGDGSTSSASPPGVFEFCSGGADTEEGSGFD